MHERSCTEIANDVRNGLTSPQKRLPSKYFYDARGSELFEQICALPEYYVTRTEMALLKEKAPEIVKGFRNGDLVELGSGANWKIRALLDAMSPAQRRGIRYVPVDVSETAMVLAAQDLLGLYPELRVTGVVADFTTDLHNVRSPRPKLVLFFGSTIGNLGKQESAAFLAEVARTLGPGDRFLLGLDLIKTPHVLEAAYNDGKGITEAFNKNVLMVVNRELDADFDPDLYEHVAFLNSSEERIEMHLKAREAHDVCVRDLDLRVSLAKHETIHTEICRKFTRESAERMLTESGLRVRQWHTDEQEWFALVEARTERDDMG
jgi:L-histidine N-alpha-methyltransferase